MVNKRPKRKVKAHPFKKYRILWLILASFGVLSAIMVVIQLAYPADRLLPFTKIGSHEVGGLLVSEGITKFQQELVETKVVLSNDGYARKIELSDLNAVPKDDNFIQEISEYNIWQRLIPFSLLFKPSQISTVELKFNQSALDKALSSIAKERNRNFKNSQISFKEGRVIINKSKNGRKLNTNNVKQTLDKTKFAIGQENKINLMFDEIKPTRTEQNYEIIKKQAESFIALPINFWVGQQQILPDVEQKANWLMVSDDKTQIKLVLNQEHFNEYVQNNLAKLVYVAPKPTILKYVDGNLAEEIPGQPGSKIDSDDLIKNIAQLVNSPEAETIYIKTVEVPSPKQTTFDYSRSQNGLQSYFNDLASRGNIKVAFTKLSNPTWSASAGANDSVVAASTYKMFVALKLFDEINSGRTSWDSSMLGTTVKSCFEIMITISTNGCSENWLGQWGRQSINDFIYQKGISQATTFTHPRAAHTSAADLQKMLIGLNNQTLFNANDSQYLLSLMRRQIHRSGIPRGTSAPVANKVGFLNGHSNDAAIVYHPKGTYVLVVMTRGVGFQKIAEITRRVEGIVYP